MLNAKAMLGRMILSVLGGLAALSFANSCSACRWRLPAPRPLRALAVRLCLRWEQPPACARRYAKRRRERIGRSDGSL